ncbi:MAG: hypothetical protein ACTSU5_02120 [Promethearchaeota archaeon]
MPTTRKASVILLVMFAAEWACACFFAGAEGEFVDEPTAGRWPLAAGDDTPDGATAIFDGLNLGSLGPGDGVDYWTTLIYKGQTFHVKLLVEGDATFNMSIIKSDGKMYTSENTSDGECEISVLLVGTVFVKVEANLTESTNYHLVASHFGEANDPAADDTMEMAKTLSIFTTRNGTLNKTDRVDYFISWRMIDHEVNVTLDAAPESRILLAVYDQDGTELASNNASGYPKTCIVPKVSREERVYIKVELLDGPETGTWYSVTLTHSYVPLDASQILFIVGLLVALVSSIVSVFVLRGWNARRKMKKSRFQDSIKVQLVGMLRTEEKINLTTAAKIAGFSKKVIKLFIRELEKDKGIRGKFSGDDYTPEMKTSEFVGALDAYFQEWDQRVTEREGKV